jgi:hypothetical protein
VTHYEALGVRVTATTEEIRRAYLQKARTHHPDVGGHDRTMQTLNEAWAVLGHAVRRQAYDRTLGMRPTPPSARPAPPPFQPDFDEDLDLDLEGPEPEAAPTTLRQETLIFLPVAVLGLAAACFAFSLVLASVALQVTAVLLVPVAALCFVMVPVLTLRKQARDSYRR